MADLYDSENDDLPLEQRLRLSVKYYFIEAFGTDDDRVSAKTHVGLFMGDTPLFADALYRGVEGWRDDQLALGYFVTRDHDCDLLTRLRATVESGARFDDIGVFEPDIRLMIVPDIFRPEIVDDPERDDFDVLAIVQYGGPWHGQGVGLSGPAVRLSATRETLRRFFLDLLADALDPRNNDGLSAEILKQRFADDVAEAIGVT